eukprot:TRINITY_DN7587_c0_g1_i1.p1 TRINITY_DN7587_c0_g1~~TRINITY_DN7587_c0_g1_i1.p1  ORF type:complete len:204 (+),score=6.73 TRINITY_DN7587_c0_g1_i1:143-754(+)
MGARWCAVKLLLLLLTLRAADGSLPHPTHPYESVAAPTPAGWDAADAHARASATAAVHDGAVWGGAGEQHSPTHVLWVVVCALSTVFVLLPAAVWWGSGRPVSRTKRWSPPEMRRDASGVWRSLAGFRREFGAGVGDQEWAVSEMARDSKHRYDSAPRVEGQCPHCSCAVLLPVDQSTSVGDWECPHCDRRFRARLRRTAAPS